MSVGSAAPRGTADGRYRAVAGGFHSDISERLRPRRNMRACDRALSGEHLPDRPAGGADRELLERIPRALHAVERQRPPEALCERDCLRQLLYVQHNREEPDRVVGELHHAVRSRAHPTAQLIPGVHELGPGRRLRRERHAGLVLGSGALGSIVRGASAVDRAPSDRRPGAPAVGLHVLGYRRSGCNCSGRSGGRRRHPDGRGDAARAIDGEGSRRPHNRVPEEERRVRDRGRDKARPRHPQDQLLEGDKAPGEGGQGQGREARWGERGPPGPIPPPRRAAAASSAMAAASEATRKATDAPSPTWRSAANADPPRTPATAFPV